MFSALFVLSILAGASAQQIGTNTPEVHPPVTVSKCTASGCTTSAQSIVLDANWRWVHTTVGYTNCYTGNTWNTAICPDGATCAANCALDGADYAATYGITTSGNAVKLNFITGTNIGSRSYLMAAGSTTQYQMFQLLNQELSFDVDVSNLGCGLNGAFYLSEMDADGGLAKYSTNKAGAAYGTGYCDAQCPQDLKFINGVANSANWTGDSGDPNSGLGAYGSCCNEMDLWEANSISAAYTPHPCSAVGQTRCTGTDCGIGNRYASLCDADGCDFNSYRMGDTSFYGPGKTVDTTKPFTIVTQFLTNDGTSTGTLSEIRRYYVQNGVTYANSQSKVAGVSGNSITTNFCAAQKSVFGDQTAFQTKGGLATMGAALAKGMVLVMSIWDDHGAEMRWLDAPYPATADPSAPGVSRGTCAADSGVPTEVESTQKGASVTYSNIKWGPINSTFASGSVVVPPGGSGSVSSSVPVSVSSATKMTTVTKPTSSSTVAVPVSSTSAPATGGASHYSQCGGIGWTGATTCAGGFTCKASNAYYSQCL